MEKTYLILPETEAEAINVFQLLIFYRKIRKPVIKSLTIDEKSEYRPGFKKVYVTLYFKNEQP